MKTGKETAQAPQPHTACVAGVVDSSNSCTLDDTESPRGMDCPGQKVVAGANRMEIRELGTPVIQKQDTSPSLEGCFFLHYELYGAIQEGSSKESRIDFSCTEAKKLELVLWGKMFCVLFNGSVVSDFLRPHGLQHTRLPCPSSPGACSHSCPLNQ